MKRHYVFLGILAVSSAFSMAQPPGGGPGGRRGEFGGPDGAQGRRPSNAVLAAIDADGDHTITALEIQNAAAALKKLDRNSDGQLTSDEVHSDREGGPGGRGGRRGPAGPQGEAGPGRPGEGPPEGRGPGHGGPPTVEQFMTRAMTFDANEDGMLNKAELQKMAAAVIEELGRHAGPPGGGPGPDGDRGGRGRGGENRQRPEFE